MTAHVDVARKYASIFMNANIKGYSQWSAGKSNNVADALSRDWHRNEKELTFILRSHFPEQMSENFCIPPLPGKISSWLTSVLWQLPISKQLREQHTTIGLELGSGGSNIASQSDAMTLILTGSVKSSKISCWELSHTFYKMPDFIKSRNVPGGGTSLHHHAHRQMVKRRIFVLHSEADGAVLASRCKTDAHFQIVSNDPRHRATSSFKQGPLAAEPPRQCQNETKYWRRQVLAGPAAIFLPFYLISQ